ncbi:MAG: B12-binding domain-containing radical SAM protein [Ignavibacteria bacterium]|nr:B12-binding domain-containing radical SAM protein [Ignavibacteria bacterium]
MRILLLANPKLYFGLDMFFRAPNLGLCSLAANLDNGLAEVKVLDLITVRQRPYYYIRKYIREFAPELVGFTSMTFQYSSTIEFIRYIKKLNPEILTLLGGYHATVAKDEIINSDDIHYVDFIIEGEGEFAFNELVKSLKNKKDYSRISGLTYKENRTVYSNPPGKLINIDSLKIPDRSIRLRTNGFHSMGLKTDAVETSRGCVFDCNFCCINMMYGKSYRKFRIERVIEDIKDAAKFGAKSIVFTDDNITLDGKRYKTLCEAITDSGLNKYKYLTQAGVKGIKDTPGLAKAMADSGVAWVFLGIENTLDRNLSAMNKNCQFNKNDIADVVGDLKQNGIVVIGGFIIGTPEDTEETILQNAEFAKEMEIDIPVYNVITPYPNTGIRNELMRQGLITNPDNFSKYDCYEINVQTKHLTSRQIEKVRYKMESMYLSNFKVFRRIMKMYPYFITKMIIRWILNKPSDLIKYSKGLFIRN